MKKIMYLAAIATSCFLFSCSKSDLSQPTATGATDAATQAAAVNRTTPAPGNYKVSLFVDEGDTATASFNGYVFTFKANGQLLAKVGTVTYKGKWESKDGGTELKLDIEGTPQLKEIDKSWDVLKMTNIVINLIDNDDDKSDYHSHGSDVLNFTKI